ncbi:MAG: amidohydrolase family protein [Actinobacteria bacterium]|nr:amidohydrolase family protein [Actinomycetota bacterium]
MLHGRRVVAGEVSWERGRLVEHVDVPVEALPPGWIVAPGFVDVQVNGFAGADVGASADANARVARALTATGVTAFCPTLVTRSDVDMRDAVETLAATAWPRDGARSLGSHLEGPFLSPERLGAHDPEHRRDPTGERVSAMLAHARPRLVTIAPELPGAIDAIRAMSRRGVSVAIGHTGADAATARRAFDAGARFVTHALNAMPGISARAPGVLGAALDDRRVRIGAIADGVHLDATVLRLLAALAGPRLVLVSDAVAAAGAPPGTYELRGRPVESDGLAVRLADGRLAGSALGIDAGVRSLVAAGVPVAAALAAASVSPRRLLGLPAPWTIGGPADLVVLDDGLIPRRVVLEGRSFPSRSPSSS